MKKLQNLVGVKTLNALDQKLIMGGRKPIPSGGCELEPVCPPISDCCDNGLCGKIGYEGRCYAM